MTDPDPRSLHAGDSGSPLDTGAFSRDAVPDGNTVIMPLGAEFPVGAGGGMNAALVASGTLVGKYQIRRLLGQGGMGTVYLGFDPLIEREVAIKLLSPELSRNAESLRRFLGEARSIGRLSHPNVVAIYAIDLWEGQYYLVMELLTGGSVAELAEREVRLPWRQAAFLLAQAARGLAAAHEAGMVHRDIKPANLMLNRDGIVKVVDFGLSRIVDTVSADAEAPTRMGQIVGTPHFMSPEQFEGGAIDARTDIYSLGATFFRLITGEFPFQRCGTIVQLMRAHMEDARPAASAIDARIPPEVDRLIQRAMARSRDDRFADALEMAEALESIGEADSGLQSRPGSAVVMSVPENQQLKSVIVAERSALQSKILQAALRSMGVTDIQVFSKIEQADAAVGTTGADLIWTGMELDDARGIDWLRKLARKGRTERSAVVLHSSDTEASELFAAARAACRVVAPKTVPPDQVVRLLHAAGPFRLPVFSSLKGHDNQRPVRILSDTEKIPEALKTLLRELQLMNVELGGMLEAATEAPADMLSLILRTAESSRDDDMVYAGLVSARRPDLRAVVQNSQSGLVLRAVGVRGAVAAVSRPFDSQCFGCLLEAAAV